MLERLSAPLSGIYRFGDLMLSKHGFTVLPPVLAETRQAFRLGLGQDRAASARRVLRIVEPERIVSAAPHWRDYLVRSWRKPTPPAAVLFPRTGPETTLWRQWLAEGWAHGTALGDDIFAADLDRLNRTFEGVVLWHRLHLVGDGLGPRTEHHLLPPLPATSACCGSARQVCGSTGGQPSISTQGRGGRSPAETCNDRCAPTIAPVGQRPLSPNSYWPEASACVSGGTARRLPAMGREARPPQTSPSRPARPPSSRSTAGWRGRPARFSTGSRSAPCARAFSMPRAKASCAAGGPSIVPMPWPRRAASSAASVAISLRCRPRAGSRSTSRSGFCPARRLASRNSVSRTRSSRPGICGAA